MSKQLCTCLAETGLEAFDPFIDQARELSLLADLLAYKDADSLDL